MSTTDPVPIACKTVGELMALHLTQAKRDVAANTFSMKEYHLGLFTQAFGSMLITELKPFHLQNWLATQTQFKSEWTIRCAIANVKRAFNWALEMELIDRNPVGRYRSRGRLITKRRPMADEDFQTLMRFSAPTYRRFLTFLRFSGCRPGEASSMRWNDIRFEERCVVLKEHKTAAKTGKPRVIPLVPTLVKMLVWMRTRRQVSVIGLLERLLRGGPVKARHVARFMSHYGVSDRAVFRAREVMGVIKDREDGTGPKGYYTYRLPEDYVPSGAVHEDEDFVFKTCQGNPFNKSNLGCWLTRMRKRAYVPLGVSLYCLRHRFGFKGTKAGVNLKLLSLVLGHSSTVMTEHYIETSGLSNEVLQAAMQTAYGPGAYEAPPTPLPLPVSTISPPPVSEIPITSEHIAKRFRDVRPRPNVQADVADVPLPAPNLSDPGELSVAQMMRQMMVIISAQKKRVLRRPTSSPVELNPAHAEAYKAVAWALEQDPSLAAAKDAEVYDWLFIMRSDCPFKVAPTFVTHSRYLSAARLFYGTRKRITRTSLPGKEGGVA
jgi:integrase